MIHDTETSHRVQALERRVSELEQEIATLKKLLVKPADAPRPQTRAPFTVACTYCGHDPKFHGPAGCVAMGDFSGHPCGCSRRPT